MSEDAIDDLDLEGAPPLRPLPPPRPTAPPPIAGDRTISPIAGATTLGRGGKGLALAGLVLGCGVFFLATGSHPRTRKAAPGDAEPARQVVDFASVSATPGRGASGPAGARGRVEGEAAIAGRSPGDDLAAAPVALIAGGAQAAPVNGVQTSGDATQAAPGAGAAPAEMAEARAAQARAELAAVRAAPMVAFRAPGPSSAQAAVEGGGGAATGTVLAAAESELDGLRRGSAIGLSRARRLPDRNYLLAAGALIPCVLETALDSSAPGFVTCRIPRDVYSDNGAVVLLDKGARVLGEYRSGFSQGRARLFVLWDRITTPDGVAVDVASPASDALGRAGFSGRVDTHFWSRFGGALLLTTVSGALSAAASSDARVATVGGPANDAASVALQGSVSIPPTLTKAQGSEVGLFVSRDLDFSGVYALKPR